MPKAFDDCIRRGGRVRTKKLNGGRFMRICFLGGKSFQGEVKTKKKESKGGDIMKFKENLSFNIQEDTFNEEKRTVRVCALATCISRNNRYYSPKIVESVSGTLKGKQSFADHDERDTKNLIGRIINEEHIDGKLFADIKISKAKGTASETFEKIKDGIIDSVSIAASGEAKEVEMNGKKVAEVTKLNVKSVDFVTEGGVDDARVLQVFENIKEIPETTEVKDMTIENVKQLREEYSDLVAEVEESLKDEVEELTKRADKAEKELADLKLGSIKEEEISKLETTDKVKDVLRDRVNGNTEEELKKSIKDEFTYIQSVGTALEKEAKIKGVKETKANENKEEEIVWTQEAIDEHADIPDNLKKDAKRLLLYQGSKAMLEFLKERRINL